MQSRPPPTPKLPYALSAHLPKKALHGAAGGELVLVDVLGQFLKEFCARAIGMIGNIVERDLAQLRPCAEVRFVGALAPAAVAVDEPLQSVVPELLRPPPQRAGRHRVVHVVDPVVHSGGVLLERLCDLLLRLGVGQGFFLAVPGIGAEE